MAMIDERIVKMTFDNSGFEKNVKNSIDSLDQLGQSVEELGRAEGVSGLQLALNNLNAIKPLEAIGEISETLSLLKIGIMKGIVDIVSEATQSAYKLAKSLSIDQVTVGWTKFEEKTRSIQTLMSALPDMGIDAINDQISILNWYSDETSYGLTDMTSAVSKFVSQGIKLEDAVQAIMGIGNAAATAGSSVSDASHAMEGFSKAMASGVMTRQVWNTWIKTSKMETMAFKQQLIDTAIEMGKLRKSSDGVNGMIGGDIVSIATFADTLQKKWLDTDVMMATLVKYGGDMNDIYNEFNTTGKLTSEILRDMSEKEKTLSIRSFMNAQEAKSFAEALESVKDAASTSWMTTFEYLFGNYEEAKVLWTDLANNLYDTFLVNRILGAEDRNSIFARWHDGVILLDEDIMKFGSDEAKVFMTKAKRNGDFVSGYELLKESLNGIFEVISQIQGAISEGFWSAFGLKPTYTITIAESLVRVTKSVKEFIDQIHLTNRTSENLTKIFKGLTSVGRAVYTVFSGIADVFKAFVSAISPAAADMFDLAGAFGDWLTDISNSVIQSEKLRSLFDSLRTFAETLGKKIQDLAKDFRNLFIKEELDETAEKVSFLDKVLTALKTVVDWFNDILSHVKSPIKVIGDLIENTIKPALKSVKEYIEQITGQEFSLSSIFDVGKSALVIGILGGLNKILNNLGPTMESFGAILKNLQGKSIFSIMKEIVTGAANGGWDAILDLVKKVGGVGQQTLNFKSDDVLKIAGTIAILAFSLSILAGVDTGGLGAATLAISGLLTVMTKCMKDLSNATGLLGNEKKGLIGKIVTLFTGSAGSSTSVNSASAALLGIAASIFILSKAMQTMSNLNIEQLALSFTAASALIWELVGVTKVLTGTKTTKFAKGMNGILKIAASLWVIAKAMQQIADIPADKMGAAMLAIMAIMAELMAFTKIANKARRVDQVGKGMLDLSIGLIILSEALKIVAGIPANDVERAFGVLSGMLLELLIALGIMNSIGSKDIKKIGSSMIPLAIGISLLGVALKIMASVGDIKTALIGLGLGLLMLAGGLAALKDGMAGAKALALASVALIPFVGAVALLGALKWQTLAKGLGAIGVALLIFAGISKLLAPMSASLLAVAGSMALFGLAIAAIGVGLVAVNLALITFSGAAAAFVIGLRIIVDQMPLIVEAVLSFFENLIAGITTKIPAIINLILVFIEQFLQAINDNFLTILTGVLQLIDNLMEGIKMAVPGLVIDLLEIVAALLNGLADAINGEQFDELMDSFVRLGTALLSRLTFGLFGTGDEMHQRALEWGQKFSDGIKGVMGFLGFEQVGADTNQMIATGQQENLEPITESANLIGDETIDTIEDREEDFNETGNFIDLGLANGIRSGKSTVIEAISAVIMEAIAIANAIAGIQSPSKVFAEMGMFMDLGLAKGLTEYSYTASDAADDLADEAIKGMSSAIAKINDYITDDIDATPVITPVVDLSNIQNANGMIGGLLGQNGGLIPGYAYGNIGGYSASGSSPSINIDFTVNNAGRDLTASDIERYSSLIVDKVNLELGGLF